MKYRITSLTVCMFILISKIYNVMTEVSTGKINDFVSKVLEPQSKFYRYIEQIEHIRYAVMKFPIHW